MYKTLCTKSYNTWTAKQTEDLKPKTRALILDKKMLIMLKQALNLIGLQVIETTQMCSLYTFTTVLLFAIMSLIAGQCTPPTPSSLVSDKHDTADRPAHLRIVRM